ncbi:hypothetical protein NADFUDRAFT_41937 [Nadsonia fulvescens var. elongata DSM 6958]|uniref:Uncharacterized protein n=1 Tax=Nadsonia fulvescens var. elongata DSM 6958 TaxID=857566 RepID=A0A1E3PLZ2_9ASCO|nr:hypothetical protein NADFUDRAFT_41937 [Nadsonia fulvescens var. elongata DSM 6958]
MNEQPSHAGDIVESSNSPGHLYSDDANETRVKNLHRTIYKQIDTIFSEYKKISSAEKQELNLRLNEAILEKDRLIDQQSLLNAQLTTVKNSLSQLAGENNELKKENDLLSARNSSLRDQLIDKDMRAFNDKNELSTVSGLEPESFQDIEWLQSQYKLHQKELAYRRKIYKQIVDKRRDDIEVVKQWKGKWQIMERRALLQRNIIRAFKRLPCGDCGAYLSSDMINKIQDQIFLVEGLDSDVQDGKDQIDLGTRCESSLIKAQIQLETGRKTGSVMKKGIEVDKSIIQSDIKQDSTSIAVTKFTIAPVMVSSSTSVGLTTTTMARNRQDHNSHNYIDEDLLSCMAKGITTPKSNKVTQGEKKAPNSAPSSSSFSKSPLVPTVTHSSRSRFANKGINFDDIDEDLHNGKNVFRGVVFDRSQKLDDSISPITVPFTTPEPSKNMKLDHWLKNKNLASSANVSPDQGNANLNLSNSDKNNCQNRSTPVKRVRYTEN